jgi:predicted deacetylase
MPELSLQNHSVPPFCKGGLGGISPLVSVHDVMPHTLEHVQPILHTLEEFEIHPISLLIVPDSGWSDCNLNVLHKLQNAGYELVGHGWKHQCFGPKTFTHTLHSLALSRNVAEHLSLNPHQIAELIDRCFQWFLQVGLHPPTLYVPPAWAMGRISRQRLADLPFRRYEYLTGIYEADTARFFHMPLVGYEADTWDRVWSLRLLNTLNHGIARLSGRPLRVVIHPYDFTLRLASDLHSLLKSYQIGEKEEERGIYP